MNSEKVILMLSGGRDSFLSACYLLEDSANYEVLMVTYDNGCSYRTDDVKAVAERIIARYGDNRAKYLGVYKTAGIAREFFDPYFNMKPEEQVKQFFGMTPSQFHCLVCRTSMYIYSIWLAQLHGAAFIAEGGRRDQKFVVELPGMACERYPELVKSAGFKLLLPVYNLDSNWIRDNELIARKYNCKSLEPKCLIGFPEDGSVDKSVIDGTLAYYDRIILPQIQRRGFLMPEKARSYIGLDFNDYDELI